MHRQSLLVAIFNQADHLVGVVHIRRHYRRHELGRVMRFQPCCLVGQQRVGGGMRFIESVAGKFFHQIENIGRLIGIDTALDRAFHENFALLGHHLRFLFTHRAAQHVGAAESVTGQHLGNLHHLLLVQNDAVGRFQNRLQIRVRVFNLHAAVLAVDEVVDHAGLQRPGPEQRHQRDNIFERIRLQAFDQIFHAARFQLEHGGGVGRLQQVESGLVIQRQGFDLQGLFALRLTAAVDVFHRPVDDGEGTQAKKVELDQTNRFNIILVELGDHAGAAFFTVQRGEVGEHGGRNHHATRVFAGVARQAFQRQRHVDQRVHVFFLVVGFFQLL